ncbi:MAG: entericidin A/B family lipoprotein, partial [Nitrosospira sp.]
SRCGSGTFCRCTGNILKFRGNKNGFFFYYKTGVAMKTFSMMVALIAVFGLSACNTMQGFGKDLQSGGEAIQKQAQ